MKFKVGDIVKDEDGDDIRIVCVDKYGPYPIVGVYLNLVYEYRNDGICLNGSDLVPPEKPKVKFLGWTTMDSLYLMVEGTIVPPNWKRVPSADCEHEVDE